VVRIIALEEIGRPGIHFRAIQKAVSIPIQRSEFKAGSVAAAEIAMRDSTKLGHEFRS